MTTENISNLFEETLKAVDVAKNIEDIAVNELPYKQQIKLLEESIKKAESQEEYKEYEQKIKDTKLNIKFNNLYYELSEEDKEKIENNYSLERREANEMYQARKNEAVETLDVALKKILPLIEEMQQINNKSFNAEYVKELLKGNVQEKPSNGSYRVLSPALDRYPNSLAGYRGTLNDLRKLLSISSQALKEPRRYRIHNDGLGYRIREQ